MAAGATPAGADRPSVRGRARAAGRGRLPPRVPIGPGPSARTTRRPDGCGDSAGYVPSSTTIETGNTSVRALVHEQRMDMRGVGPEREQTERRLVQPARRPSRTIPRASRTRRGQGRHASCGAARIRAEAVIPRSPRFRASTRRPSRHGDAEHEHERELHPYGRQRERVRRGPAIPASVRRGTASATA